MMHLRPLSVVSSVLLVASLLAACGGSGGESGGESVATSSPGIGSGVDAPASTDVAPPTSEVAPLVSAGATTGLAAGAGATTEISAAIDGTVCTADDPLVSCMGATGSGGQFVVTVESDASDFTIRTVGVRCGLSPAVATANVTGEQLVLLGQLNFAEFGGVIGVARYGAGDEAFLVYQPSGATCPEVFGLGPIKLNSIMQGGNDVVGITRPDGSLACAAADGTGAFVVSEQQSGCKL